MNYKSNVKLSKEQQAVENARSNALEVQIENGRKQAKANKDMDYGITPDILDKRSFAEIQYDEVLKKERLYEYANKLFNGDTIQGSKLAERLYSSGLDDYFLQNYTQIFKEINTSKSIGTVTPAFKIIKDMESGDNELLTSNKYKEGINDLLTNLSNQIANLISETKTGSKKESELIELSQKVEALNIVIAETGQVPDNDSGLPTEEDIIELSMALEEGKLDSKIIEETGFNNITQDVFDEWFNDVMGYEFEENEYNDDEYGDMPDLVPDDLGNNDEEQVVNEEYNEDLYNEYEDVNYDLDTPERLNEDLEAFLMEDEDRNENTANIELLNEALSHVIKKSGNFSTTAPENFCRSLGYERAKLINKILWFDIASGSKMTDKDKRYLLKPPSQSKLSNQDFKDVLDRIRPLIIPKGGQYDFNNE